MSILFEIVTVFLVTKRNGHRFIGHIFFRNFGDRFWKGLQNGHRNNLNQECKSLGFTSLFAFGLKAAREYLILASRK
jgi:hypothetical protein